MFILATIIVGQTIFFKQFYTNKKVNDVKINVNSFEKDYLKSEGNSQVNQKLEQDFYREHNTWITTLDGNGYLKNVNDFYIEVKLNPSKNKEKQFADSTISIPLYNFKFEGDYTRDMLNEIFPLGKTVILQGIENNSTFIPYLLFSNTKNPNLINPILEKRITDILIQQKNKYNSKEIPKIDTKEYKRAFEEQLPITYLEGNITNVQLLGRNEQSNFAYTNNLFMERIQEFQANLLLNEPNANYNSLQEIDYEQNDIKYKIIIKPIKDKSGEVTYIFSMASLQPVDEAVQMIKEYYVYIVLLVLVLIFLSSFYYSKKIAKPLLQINKTTKQIANLDFSERVSVESRDEIGDLSQNINLLSNTLHSHIEQLQRDIEKEKN